MTKKAPPPATPPNRAARRRAAREATRAARPVSVGPGRAAARADDRWSRTQRLQRALLESLGYQFSATGLYVDPRPAPSTSKLLARWHRQQAQAARRRRDAQIRRARRSEVTPSDGGAS